MIKRSYFCNSCGKEISFDGCYGFPGGTVVITKGWAWKDVDYDIAKNPEAALFGGHFCNVECLTTWLTSGGNDNSPMFHCHTKAALDEMYHNN